MNRVKQFESGIPACWTWPLPDPAEITAAEDLFCRIMLMGAWQQDRCAVCGRLIPYSYVVDHDHKTGFARGYLCQSCNTRESQPGLLIFDRYRHVNPASICHVEWFYREPTWRPPLTENDFEDVRNAIDAALRPPSA